MFLNEAAGRGQKSRKHQGLEHLSPAECGIDFTACQHFDESFIVVIKSFYVMETLIILGNSELSTSSSLSTESVRLLRILSSEVKRRKRISDEDAGSS